MYVYICMYLCICILCIWKSKVNIENLPWLLSALSLRQDLSLKMQLSDSLLRLASEIWRILVSTLPKLGLQICMNLLFFYCYWWSELMSLCLYSMHLTDQAISLALPEFSYHSICVWHSSCLCFLSELYYISFNGRNTCAKILFFTPYSIER